MKTKNLIFILSTGRTGTQFFEDYINQTTDKALCKHEPKPSRRFKFLSNLYLDNKVSEKFVADIYQFSRKSLLNNLEDRIYIESSNFIFGCIPALNQYYDDIKIIHIVRHPFSYIESHLNHGFWKGHKKIFAKYIPYWLEKIVVKNPFNPVDVLAARWNYVNELIKTYSNTNDYLMVRFEDIFTDDKKIASEQLNKIRAFCNLSLIEEEENYRWIKRPKNVSKQSHYLSINEKDNVIIKNKSSMMKYDYL